MPNHAVGHAAQHELSQPARPWVAMTVRSG